MSLPTTTLYQVLWSTWFGCKLGSRVTAPEIYNTQTLVNSVAAAAPSFDSLAPFTRTLAQLGACEEHMSAARGRAAHASFAHVCVPPLFLRTLPQSAQSQTRVKPGWGTAHTSFAHVCVPPLFLRALPQSAQSQTHVKPGWGTTAAWPKTHGVTSVMKWYRYLCSARKSATSTRKPASYARPWCART